MLITFYSRGPWVSQVALGVVAWNVPEPQLKTIHTHDSWNLICINNTCFIIIKLSFPQTLIYAEIWNVNS